ncbi:MAG: hypothetical protein ACK5M5_14680 [Limnobaculum xujianqingii]
MNNDMNLEYTNNLIDRLLVRRSTNDENSLCSTMRHLSGEEKLTIIERLGNSNVRLAASIAARVHLPVDQQLVLLSHILCGGKSNAIKQFTIGLFAYRLSTKKVIRLLMALNDKYPDSVKLMAYYYKNSVNKMNHKDKILLDNLIKTNVLD